MINKAVGAFMLPVLCMKSEAGDSNRWGVVSITCEPTLMLSRLGKEGVGRRVGEKEAVLIPGGREAGCLIETFLFPTAASPLSVLIRAALQ